VAQIFGGGLLERLAFSASVLLIVASLPGPGITFWEALLVAGGAVAVGGIIPTPGGIGVSAGATAALLVVVGVPEATALAAAILMRAFNIYLPALYGVEALRELRRAKLL
jgi:uncharacterized membrane protein YbhN (UPF0104 family)